MKTAMTTLLLCLCLFSNPASANPGKAQNFGVKDWGRVNSMTALGGRIYVGGSFLRTVEKSGKEKKLTPTVDGWGRIAEMTTLNGKIYCVSEETLYELDPSGKARALTPEWGNVPGMAALNGKLYIVSAEVLYEVEPSNGKYTALSKEGDWYNVDGVAALDGKLYILRRDRLNEVDQSGNARELEGVWNDARGIAVANGKLYIATSVRAKPGDKLINEWVLDSFDPKTGERTRISPFKGWDRGTGVDAIAALDGKLYIVQANSNFLVLTLK